MILTNQQAAAVLTLMDAGGTGTVSFNSPVHHDVVTVRISGVIVSRFRADGQHTKPEEYASADHFKLAYRKPGVPNVAFAAAHYCCQAAKTFDQLVIDGEGRN